jgi:2-keto-4-pentenoate hydratase
MTPEATLHHFDCATVWPAGSGLDIPSAYQHALAVRALRVARGERARGYKIGFTNRNIWPRYNVAAPVWGTVWNTSLSFCEGQGSVSLANTCQPRIEPEAVFGLRSTPPPDATLEQVYACVEWLAPGFEVVQSHQLNWKFLAPDTIADGGLHAKLLVGTRVPVQSIARTAHDLAAALAACTVQLQRGDALIETGRGSHVLESPLHALHYFLCELRQCKGAPDLQAGDVVTTGTWTDAWPIAAGQAWQAKFDSVMPSLGVQFT